MKWMPVLKGMTGKAKGGQW